MEIHWGMEKNGSDHLGFRITGTQKVGDNWGHYVDAVINPAVRSKTRGFIRVFARVQRQCARKLAQGRVQEQTCHQYTLIMSKCIHLAEMH